MLDLETLVNEAFADANAMVQDAALMLSQRPWDGLPNKQYYSDLAKWIIKDDEANLKKAQGMIEIERP